MFRNNLEKLKLYKTSKTIQPQSSISATQLAYSDLDILCSKRKKKSLPKLGCCGDCCCCSCCCFSNMAMSVADEFAEDGFIGKAEKLKYYKIIALDYLIILNPPNSISNLSESCVTVNPKS